MREKTALVGRVALWGAAWGLCWGPLARAADTKLALSTANEIRMLAGRSVVLEHPDDIVRISVANPEVLDAVAVTTREVLLNGKLSGTTSLILWSKPGERQLFTVTVDSNLEPVQRQINETFVGEQIQVHAGRDAITLTGQVSSAAVAERAAALASGAAKTMVNHLQVMPPGEKQILLRVKFAEVDRVALSQLGMNLISTGALNTPGSLSTQQFSPPGGEKLTGIIGARVTGTTSEFNLTDVLNIFAFRPDLNLAVLLKALQSRNLLQILAEPNIVTSNGREATFLAGGEFPVPVLQGGANAGSVTIQFREFGVRVNFLPQLTGPSRIRLRIRPEVSSLDFTNALVLGGFTIPALSTRRVETDIELELGQSFAMAGLLDQRATEQFSRVPGLSSLPLLGNLFKSRTINKTNSELMVVVTPEILGPGVEVRPSALTMDRPMLPFGPPVARPPQPGPNKKP